MIEAGRATDELILWTWDLEHTDWAVSTDYRDATKFLESLEEYGFTWALAHVKKTYYLTIVTDELEIWSCGEAHNLPLAVARAALRDY